MPVQCKYSKQNDEISIVEQNLDNQPSIANIREASPSARDHHDISRKFFRRSTDESNPKGLPQSS